MGYQRPKLPFRGEPQIIKMLAELLEEMLR